MSQDAFDPTLDLVLERVVEIPKEWIWEAWTEPKHLIHWFTPVPWQTTQAEIDLRPGGLFRTTMRSPEGQDFDNSGCYLEVVKNRRLVWTDALVANYRPATKTYLESFNFTARLTLEDHPKGTLYRAVGMHKDAADRKRHEEMGFETGWGKVLEQLIAYMKGVKG
ncbi:MAG: polyketide cyclase [Candidatus Lambdaproteobacteria bacterium RIFOXYD1_FULL_56_27]|uniref:Polyketide cyclase n=1 Tax=Candidatus Lambdaproteobacteria bacterium RIFOXYD2_FULL_56_26 TaxID=1817773 RepID=A0A1F6H421_9PROT|nr:MAG: polyketide cyclase [Candidatus Lambdaproteobacteria bacterium RIFOXYC1_FULL_56_13]OGH05112.1 MAG: polyketide cyclase [Candidatus Lambdaproteobacteria bacterium RIFOXYD2_FULL_56_26]OGH09576.1 MAG: polyketide cyclase [Candidatus Lambdaproteobacteria bacterium RIFOXYD1_FULL_56_27]